MGSSPTPTILSMQVSILIYIYPKMGYWIGWATVTKDPIISYQSSASLGGMLMTKVGLLLLNPSPSRACAISTNPGGGHGDFRSGFNCNGIASWGGVAGASAFLMVVGQLSPQAADGDPLGWAQKLWLWLWL